MYISANQFFIKEEDVKLSIKPWDLQNQGCILTEDIRANAAMPLLVDEHYKLLKQNAELLKFALPPYFTPDFIKSQANGILTRNKLFQAANVRLTIMRDIASNQTEIIMTSQYAGTGPYEDNTKGLFTDIYNEAYITTHRPNQLDQHCQLINAMAKVSAIQKGLDDMLLITDQGFIVSATDSAIFAIQKGKMLTPPLELGVRNDVMRKIVLDAATNIGYKVDSEAFIMPEDLNEMDEIFLCNTAKGIQWISGVKRHRYIHKESKKIVGAVNNIIFSESQTQS